MNFNLTCKFALGFLAAFSVSAAERANIFLKDGSTATKEILTGDTKEISNKSVISGNPNQNPHILIPEDLNLVKFPNSLGTAEDSKMKIETKILAITGKFPVVFTASDGSYLAAFVSANYEELSHMFEGNTAAEDYFALSLNDPSSIESAMSSFQNTCVRYAMWSPQSLQLADKLPDYDPLARYGEKSGTLQEIHDLVKYVTAQNIPINLMVRGPCANSSAYHRFMMAGAATSGDTAFLAGGLNTLRGLTQSTYPNSLYGNGVKVHVMDIQLLQSHSAFRDAAGASRISPNSSATWSANLSGTSTAPTVVGTMATHGTQIASVISGRGLGSATYPDVGLLPQSVVTFSSLLNFTDLRQKRTATQTVISQDSVRFQNSSWGTAQATGNSYTPFAALMDQTVFENNLLIVQAIGNSGNSGGANARSLPEALAKNVLTVGSVGANITSATPWNDFQTANWSNAPGFFGSTSGYLPATDVNFSRIKPDVVGFRDAIKTATWDAGSSPSGTSTGFTGNSLATALVSGHVGAIYEMWTRGILPASGFLSASLAKALVIHTARRLPNVEFEKQGYGHPDIKKLYDLRTQLAIVNEATQIRPNQELIYYFYVPTQTPDMRVTLNYLDPPPSTFNAGLGVPNPDLSPLDPNYLTSMTTSLNPLVQDLDLTVETPRCGRPASVFYSGNYGLNLNGASTLVESGATIPHDHINTTEQIRIVNACAGYYAIKVKGFFINTAMLAPGKSGVPYALVASPGQMMSVSNIARAYMRDPNLSMADSLRTAVISYLERSLTKYRFEVESRYLMDSTIPSDIRD